MTEAERPETPDSTQIALAGVSVIRPRDGDVELTTAAPAVRQFPMRVSDSLGICLKRGAAHRVVADGRRLVYPGDAVCVRPPGCVWSSEAEVLGFVSIDIPPRLLPESGLTGSMSFAPGAAWPGIAAAIPALLTADSLLRVDEVAVQIATAIVEEGLLATETPVAGRAPGVVERACEFLAEALDQRPTLDEIARAAEVDKFVLVRSFRRVLGTTPHAYLVLLRLNRAQALLARGEPTGEAARAAGFADQSHLARWFRRVHGVTPGGYARQVRRA